MPVPAVGKILATFAKHPLAEQDHRYDDFIKGLNLNIASYILETDMDKDSMLNDNGTGLKNLNWTGTESN
jgi:hypothetical protein